MSGFSAGCQRTRQRCLQIQKQESINYRSHILPWLSFTGRDGFQVLNPAPEYAHLIFCRLKTGG